MTRSMIRIALAAAVSLAAVTVFAQSTSTTSETKTFEILAVRGNSLVVKLPEGTRELTVPNDFRFMFNGRELSLLELKAGMKGTATLTTRTTLTPVTGSGSTASATARRIRTLPRTASAWPSLGFASALVIAIGLALTVRRRIAG